MNKELHKFLNRNIDDIIELTRKIEDMIDQPHKYGYADSVLRGILEHIELTGVVTEKQKKAIVNIQNKPNKMYGRKRNKY